MRIGRMRAPGHPDKACDLIAETVVDEYFRRDPATRLRMHVAGGKGALFLTGIVASKADFDVGAIAARAAGMLGARKPVEPFVALEPIGTSGIAETMRMHGPVNVTGYATRETPELLPTTVSLARRAAKRLDTLRTSDPDWFWLEPGFVVEAVEASRGTFRVYLACGHGDRPLDEARALLREALAPVIGDAELRVNTRGPVSGWSLDHDMGSSGSSDEPYGSSLMTHGSFVGVDVYHPRKFGAWFARSLARKALLRSDAQAVMVRAVYEPGETAPSWFSVRDEQGRDRSIPGDRDVLRDLSLANGLRNGLNADAARWGFAGEAGMPWEDGDSGQ